MDGYIAAKILAIGKAWTSYLYLLISASSSNLLHIHIQLLPILLSFICLLTFVSLFCDVIMYIRLYSCTCRMIVNAELQVTLVTNFLFSDPYMRTISCYFHTWTAGNHKNRQASNRNGSLLNTHLEGSNYTSLLDRRPFLLLLIFPFQILLLLWFLFHVLFFLF